MLPVRIIDIDFQLLGEIDNYESLQFTRRFYRPGEFELHIEIGKRYVDELLKDRIIMLGGQQHKAGYIVSREIQLSESGAETVVVKGVTLEGILDRRITVTDDYDRVRGPAETVMKHYVHRHMVDGIYPDRAMSFFSVATDLGRGIETPRQSRYEPLDQLIEAIAKWCDIGWFVQLDIAARKWIFDVLEGRNLTAEQNLNPPVIFSRGFDNILSQNFVESNSRYRNVGYVGGSGEEDEQTVLVVGGGTGFDRREVFIDATEAEDAGELLELGEQKLAGYSQITTFDGQVIDTGSFEYERDWDLGDIITLQDLTWGVQSNTRIIEVREIYEQTIKIEVQLGDEIPTITAVVKSLQTQVERKATVSNSGAQGVPGPIGPKGDKGDKGDTGERGLQGIQGEKGDVGSQGPKGDQGDPGPKGEKGDTGSQGPKGDPGDTGPRGEKGDKGDPGEQGPPGASVADSVEWSKVLNKPTYYPANSLDVIDTRTVSDMPGDLPPRKITSSFKNRTAVNNPPVGANSTYVFIMNILGWNANEGSGGWPIQLAFGSEGLAFRQAMSDTAWGQWQKIGNAPVVSSSEPVGLTAGDWWYQEV